MAQTLTLQAKALYQALSAKIDEGDDERGGELDAAFDILDPLIDSLSEIAEPIHVDGSDEHDCAERSS